MPANSLQSALRRHGAFKGCKLGHVTVHPECVIVTIEDHSGISSVSEARVLGRFEFTGNPTIECALDLVANNHVMEVALTEKRELIFRLDNGFLSVKSQKIVWRPRAVARTTGSEAAKPAKAKAGKPAKQAKMYTHNVLADLPLADRSPNAHPPYAKGFKGPGSQG